ANWTKVQVTAARAPASIESNTRTGAGTQEPSTRKLIRAQSAPAVPGNRLEKSIDDVLKRKGDTDEHSGGSGIRRRNDRLRHAQRAAENAEGVPDRDGGLRRRDADSEGQDQTGSDHEPDQRR